MNGMADADLVTAAIARVRVMELPEWVAFTPYSMVASGKGLLVAVATHLHAGTPLYYCVDTDEYQCPDGPWFPTPEAAITHYELTK